MQSQTQQLVLFALYPILSPKPWLLLVNEGTRADFVTNIVLSTPLGRAGAIEILESVLASLKDDRIDVTETPTTIPGDPNQN